MARISEWAKGYKDAEGNAVKSNVVVDILEELGQGKKTAASTMPEEAIKSTHEALLKKGYHAVGNSAGGSRAAETKAAAESAGPEKAENTTENKPAGRPMPTKKPLGRPMPTKKPVIAGGKKPNGIFVVSGNSGAGKAQKPVYNNAPQNNAGLGRIRPREDMIDRAQAASERRAAAEQVVSAQEEQITRNAEPEVTPSVEKVSEVVVKNETAMTGDNTAMGREDTMAAQKVQETAVADVADKKDESSAANNSRSNSQGTSPENGNSGRSQGNRDHQNQGSYGNRDNYGNRNNQGGYGNRDNQGQGGYGNRGGQGGYGNRDNQGQGGYGNRSGQGGYGNRENQGQGGYGNRSGQGGYGNRDNRGGQGGYGNRDNRGGQGGYGNRDNRGGQGGFGNRGGQGGFGNRDNQGQGGYGNRGGQGGYGNGGGNRFGGGRPSGGPGRGGFAAQATPQENDRNRRNKHSEKDRDKENKRESLYEDKNVGKGRNNNAGRFIKPVKKAEVVEEDAIKVITLPDSIIVKDLADKMRVQPSEIIKKLFLQGEMVTVNQEISFEKAEEIALDYEIMCEREEKVDVIAELLKEEDEAEENLVSRPPVICVMGHVDHGKTSLLDAIRKTNVTDREAGGITQHIGAYTVNAGGRQITFLDTPGHEAFTAMRMRGANSTDIAILVVAADDGVMPQTIEAINHAKAAGIEIIVAVNKIDKPGANVDRVKQELTEYELVSEDWGGSTVFVPVSAKTGEGIDNLLEMILLTADVLELKSNPNRMARGMVIEAQLDKGRGPVATVLVQKGTLHVGDFVSAGATHGKVRAMIDDKGRRVKEAGPSVPVEILGLDDVPNAGEIFISHKSEKDAKNFADTFIAQNKEKLLEDTKAKMSLDDLFSKIQEGNLKELNLIIKADVQGSVEAVRQSLLKLSNEEVVVKVIHGGVGAINESDVVLASASNAIIIGFNVRPDAVAKQTAEHEGVDVRLYKVIYQAIEDVEAAMKGMLDPVYEEKIIGHAEVRQIFKASAVGNIAGSYVLDGVFQRDCKIRITREGEQIYEGALASLKRFKDDVKEVKAGYECGLVFEDFDAMQELDQVEAYIMVEVPR